MMKQIDRSKHYLKEGCNIMLRQTKSTIHIANICGIIFDDIKKNFIEDVASLGNPFLKVTSASLSQGISAGLRRYPCRSLLLCRCIWKASASWSQHTSASWSQGYIRKCPGGALGDCEPATAEWPHRFRETFCYYLNRCLPPGTGHPYQ